MSVTHLNRWLCSIRLYLAVSVLLHGLCFVAVILLAPTFIQPTTQETTIIMTNLVSLSQPKTGNETKAPASASPATSKPAPQAAPQPAPPTIAAPTMPSSNPPAKRNEPALEAPRAQSSSLQQAKGTAISKTEASSQPAVQTSAATGGNRGTPQEMAFGSASGPAFHRQAVPVYPTLAKRRNKEGVVLLRLSISETGQLTRLEVLEDPGYGFADAAQEALRSSSFIPAHHNGKPVAVRAILPVRFSLRQGPL